MTGSSPRLAAVLFPSVAIAVVGLAAVALWSDISPEERLAATTMLTQPRVGLLVLFGIVLVGALGFLAYRSLIPVARAGQQLAEAVRLIAHGNATHRVPAAALPALRDVAEAVNELAAERARLLVDVDKAVTEAKTRVEEERNRLAALVAELDQSVLGLQSRWARAALQRCRAAPAGRRGTRRKRNARARPFGIRGSRPRGRAARSGSARRAGCARCATRVFTSSRRHPTGACCACGRLQSRAARTMPARERESAVTCCCFPT